MYLDANIVIYSIEKPAIFGAKAEARLLAAQAGGDTLAFSDLVRLECRCRPLAIKDTAILALYDDFFALPDLLRASFTTAVFDRATRIRADHKFTLGDTLHLAAALGSGCDAFLTSDTRLVRFPDLMVEVLS